jgi:hypothetical protein
MGKNKQVESKNSSRRQSLDADEAKKQAKKDKALPFKK